MATVMNNEGEYGKYFVTELHAPEFSPEFLERYKKFGNRVRWIDGDMVPGAFQMNASWYHSALDEPLFEEHVHDNDEMVCFFGSDPENPDDLGGIVEFGMNGEMHRIDKSCMIFIPGGMKHLPLSLVKVDRPIFHCSICLSATYDSKDSDGRSIYDAPKK
jgi:hypothetical protein